MTPRVPLRWRAPNPPSPFVGRDDDVIRLQTLLRGPVAVVWGFSGVGKSALVQAVLHGPGVDMAARTLWLRADAAIVATLTARLLELGVVAGPAVEDVADALEQTRLVVVVDGVERLDDHVDLGTLVRLLARHGRDARLVCVCREDPRDPTLATRTLRVDPLDDDALARLLDDVAPRVPAAGRRALIAAAQGSPWRLVQLAVDGGVGPAAPEASLLALSPVARGLLSTLALAGSGGLPTGLLQQVTRLPDDEALRGLARRGWVERVGDHLHLHHAAVPFVVTTISLDERRRRRARLMDALFASLLEADDDVRAAVARAGLALARERLDDEGAAAAGPMVRRLLLEVGPALRARGNGAALWDLVVDAGLVAGPVDDDLVVALAWLAVDVGDAALAVIGTLPASPAPATRVALAALRSARGDHPEALALLRGLVTDAAAADAAHADALIDSRVAALALALERGDDDIAAALVERLPSSLQTALAPLLSASSSPSLFTSSSTSPLATWPALPAGMQGMLLPALCESLLAIFRVDDVLELIGTDDGSGTARGRRLALLRARALVAAGEPDPWPDLDGLAVDAGRRAEAGLWRLIGRARRGLSDDERERAAACLAVDEVGPAPRLERLVLALRRGPLEEQERRQSADPGLDRVLATLGASPTTERAMSMRAAARAGGDRLAALELGFVVADALLAAGPDRAGALAAQADAIEQEARVLASPRGLDEGRLLRGIAVAPAGGGDGVTLAALAQGGHGVLIRRRARFLLGDGAATPFDRATLPSPAAGVRPPSAVVAVAGSGSEREWTVDEARRRVVVGTDVVIELADKGILFGLLVALGRRGGHATKEQLQADVWGERHYHPLRHDNRLKVAVRKLRRLLEEALGEDPLEASDDGYRLRGRVRFVS